MTVRQPRVLLVEDEFMIAEFIAGLLTANGFAIAGMAGTTAAALAMIETLQFDCALLDVNLRGEPVTPVADRLAELGKPYIFLTGYAAHRVPEGHQNVPCISKPVKIPELLAALKARICDNDTAI
jgi:DNA-binding response OmpR family regulator